MIDRILNMPFKVLGKAARKVQERDAERRRAAGDADQATAVDLGPRRSPLDTPEDFDPGDVRISAQDLLDAVAAGQDLQIVDVRSKDEHARGHLPRAHAMPGETIVMGLAEIPSDGRIVVYGDRAGRHARRVTLFLRYRGLDDSWYLDGGLPAWQAAGGALERR